MLQDDAEYNANHLLEKEMQPIFMCFICNCRFYCG